MGARPGEWSLLHENDDPMSADVEQVNVISELFVVL